MKKKINMEHDEEQGRKVVHLQLGDEHYYYGSIKRLFEDYKGKEELLGISYSKTKNNLKKQKILITDKCVIRLGVLKVQKPKQSKG